jgi:transposase
MGWGVHDYPAPPPEPPAPTCPVCGQECETIVLDVYGDAVGCMECIKTVDAYLWRENNV